jgi:hypothetical protein
VELVGFDFGGLAFLPTDPAWFELAPSDADPHPVGSHSLFVDDAEGVVMRAFGANGVQRAADSSLQYVRCTVPLTVVHALDAELDFNARPEIRVVTRIWGLDNVQSTLVRDGLPQPLDPEDDE